MNAKHAPESAGPAGALSCERSALPFEDSSELLSNGPALRAKGARDGYLFFRRLLPEDALLTVRAELLRIVERHGWLAPDPDPLAGKLNVAALSAVLEAEMRTDIGVSTAAYDDVQRLACVHGLPHHPSLLAIYRTLFDGEVLVHPRHIVRMISPHPSVFPTPQHQDYPLIQGTPRTWTCWFPIGKCPREMGALTVLRGSHVNGYLPVAPARGAGGIAAQTCPGENDWIEGDFEPGDVLTFPSFTVHRALPSRVRDRIRLSFDVRYQPLADPVDAASLQPHCGLSWENIYAGWPPETADLQYYWRRVPLTMSPWDPTLMQPSRRIC